jgi:hypothetical protein
MNTLAYLGMYGAKPINSQAKNAVGFTIPKKKRRKPKKPSQRGILRKRVKASWFVDVMKEVVVQTEWKGMFGRKS